MEKIFSHMILSRLRNSVTVTEILIDKTKDFNFNHYNLRIQFTRKSSVIGILCSFYGKYYCLSKLFFPVFHSPESICMCQHLNDNTQGEEKI